MINEIKHKLRKFVIKYHINEMIRGAIFAITGLLAAFLIIVTAEYLSYFSTTVRKIIVFSYLIFSAYILYRFVISALLKIYGVSKPMSGIEASRYIGNYMTEVSDKLINLIQLSNISQKSKNKDFLEKALEQKSKELKPFQFQKIIDLRVNRKYLRYLAIPVGIFLILIISAPATITEPTKRIAKFNKKYKEPQLFYINMLNNNLEVVEGENLDIRIKTKGEKVPNKLYYIAGNERRKLERIQENQYKIKLKNINESKKFHITNGIIESETYEINILKKPEIIGYNIKLDYPEYIEKEDEEVKNNGDLIVPRGTNVKWNFKTKNTKFVKMLFGEDESEILKKDYSLEKPIKEDFQYSVITSNKEVKHGDTMTFNVTVIPDKYPEIKLSIVDDTSAANRVFYNGLIGDDYGFNRLIFIWRIKGEGQFKSKRINIDKDIRKQNFYYSFKKDNLVDPGDELKYYFKVWDNDVIQGPKSTRTNTRILKEPSKEKIEEKIEKQNEEIKKSIKSTADELENINRKLKERRKELINKKNMDWEERKNIKNILEKSEELQKKIDNLKKKLENKNKKEDKISKKEEEILKKEEKLQKLMDKVLDKELKKKMKELRKMLEKRNKDKLQQSIKEISRTNKNIEKQLERNLELFKRLEVEKELKEATKKLKELEKEQEKTIHEDDEQKIKRKQKKINEEFDNVKKKMEKAREKNKKLEQPFDLKNTEEKENSIKRDLNKAVENLKKGNQKRGKQSQQNAQQKMKELSKKMEQMMMEMKQKSMGEDMETIRTLMRNTIKLSFDQEKLMKEFENISKDDPKFIDLIQKQKDLKEKLQKVKDSLYALSKRQIMIQSFVNKELGEIDKNMEKALESMLALNTIARTRKRDKDEAISRQQYIMKGLNNIALMLSESMEKMKQKMRKQSGKMSKKSCKNPKPGKGKSLKEMQKELNKKLEQMRKEMKQGTKKGKEGKSMSEKFARAAAKQRAIRKKLEEIRKKMQSEGKETDKSIGETLKEMEKTEEDLVNKILNSKTIKRQEEIETRLLEHQEAKRQQEHEKERKAEEAKNEKNSNPKEFLEYKSIKEKETELLRLVPPELLPFYKKKMNEYYINLGR